jgi:hypothetical protein
MRASNFMRGSCPKDGGPKDELADPTPLPGEVKLSAPGPHGHHSEPTRRAAGAGPSCLGRGSGRNGAFRTADIGMPPHGSASAPSRDLSPACIRTPTPSVVIIPRGFDSFKSRSAVTSTCDDRADNRAVMSFRLGSAGNGGVRKPEHDGHDQGQNEDKADHRENDVEGEIGSRRKTLKAPGRLAIAVATAALGRTGVGGITLRPVPRRATPPPRLIPTPRAHLVRLALFNTGRPIVTTDPARKRLHCGSPVIADMFGSRIGP